MIAMALGLGGFALLVALGALWYAGEASKKSEFQQHQFYDAHVKGLRATVQETSKTVQSLVGQVEAIKKSGGGREDDGEDSGRVQALEEKLNKVGAAVEKIGAALTAMTKG
jgi:hypothetical protein